LVDLEYRILEAKAVIEVGELPCIEADPMQMRQMFQNLIANAIKFKKPNAHPHVVIRTCCQSPSEVVIEVQDDGLGFEPCHAEKIFGVFQRLHSDSSIRGTGIGLAIVRKIVQRHQGSIKAISEPQQGATFVITLPCYQIDVVSALAPHSPSPTEIPSVL
jgi:light-regulated signal transduction histidine kinase (bacteriophytochrome)